VTLVNDASTINVIDDASLAMFVIVIDAPSVVKSDAPNCSVTFDDTRSVDYDRNSFIIQATGCLNISQKLVYYSKTMFLGLNQVYY
jgi:hypothetical protein